MKQSIQPQEVVFYRKDASSIFASIPDGSRIIIMPSGQATEWFHQDHDIIQEEIRNVRKMKREIKLQNDYSSLIEK